MQHSRHRIDDNTRVSYSGYYLCLPSRRRQFDSGHPLVKFEFKGREIGVWEVYDTYTHFAILHPSRKLNEKGMIDGPGIDLKITHPKSKYRMPHDYSLNNSDGWDKMFSVGYFYHDYGKCNGVGVEDDGQLILFNLYQIPPIIAELYSRVDFRKQYYLAIVGVAYGNIYFRFGTTPLVSPEVSGKTLQWITLFKEGQVGKNSLGESPPAPKKVTVVDYEKTSDFTTYKVEVDPKRIIHFDEPRLTAGLNGMKDALKRFYRDPEDDDEPVRFLSDRKKEELKFDNQLELF